MDVLVPYSRTISLGTLNKGRYRVVAYDKNSRAHSVGMVGVTQAVKPNPDDFLYAPVTSSVFFMKANKPFLILSGEFTKNCMGIKDIKVLSRTRKVVEVLPLKCTETLQNVKM